MVPNPDMAVQDKFVDASGQLRNSKVSVAPGTYSIAALTHNAWSTLLSDPSLSPSMTTPFMIFMDQYEVTLVLDEEDLRNMRSGLADAKIAGGYRLLTFEAEMDLSVVGFTAEISRILAEAGVPILAISAFTRDHLLIRQSDLATALKALGPHVAELC